MKRLLFLTCALFIAIAANAQTAPSAKEKPHIYDPNANAAADIQQAVTKAAREHKHVLLQVGGNWCVWCVRFHELLQRDTMLSRLVRENYVVLHVNYSPENKNRQVLANLGYPQRFGFPVFVVLDGKGNRLHTQNSAYLEEGKGHSPEKVAEFLRQWSPAALDPRNYKE